MASPAGSGVRGPAGFRARAAGRHVGGALAAHPGERGAAGTGSPEAGREPRAEGPRRAGQERRPELRGSRANTLIPGGGWGRGRPQGQGQGSLVLGPLS